MPATDHALRNPGARPQGEEPGTPPERRESPQARRAAELEQEIDTELVKHLIGQAATGFVTGTLTVAAVVFVLWSAAPRSVLLAWLALIGLLSLPAFLVVWRFRRSSDTSRNIATWRRALTVAYGLAGAGWGAASFLLYPRVAMPYQLFLLFVLGGSGVGGMAALAPVRGAFVAYLAATFLPMIGQLVAEGSLSSIATGLLLVTFWVATMALASELRDLLVRSLKLRFENLELIDDLSSAKDQARSGKPYQVGVPGQHEPRAPHTTRAHPRTHAKASGFGSVRREGEP